MPQLKFFPLPAKDFTAKFKGELFAAKDSLCDFAESVWEFFDNAKIDSPLNLGVNPS